MYAEKESARESVKAGRENGVSDERGCVCAVETNHREREICKLRRECRTAKTAAQPERRQTTSKEIVQENA